MTAQQNMTNTEDQATSSNEEDSPSQPEDAETQIVDLETETVKADDLGEETVEDSSGVSPDPNRQKEIEEARAKKEDQEKYIRLQAEFENYKKRMHREQSESLKYAQMPLLRDMTGVMDNLVRAIDHARDNENPDPKALLEGLDMVVKQVGDVFERYGMKRITAKGETFDPNRHEAMSVNETDEVEENTVLEEFQTGYTLHDRVVRPAMVIVSKKPAST